MREDLFGADNAGARYVRTLTQTLTLTSTLVPTLTLLFQPQWQLLRNLGTALGDEPLP